MNMLYFSLFHYFHKIINGFLLGETCFPNIGCFNNSSPWTTFQRPAFPPESPEETHPFLYFYNRKLSEGKTFEVYPETSFSNFHFELNKDTYVIIHGYHDNGTLPWIIDLKNALIDKKDVNVFILDYSKGGGGNYAQAVGNIRLFGRIYANAFNKIGIPFSRLHLIGHSLGSQLASYIAKEMKNMGYLVGWLTALDPAGPLFEDNPKEVRLHPSDAEFVDVHHTDSGVQGMVNPVGHVDFYYNGGTHQPCESAIFNKFGCGHQMVHQFYISSIQNECLYGVQSNLKLGAELMFKTLTRGELTEYKNKKCTYDTCIPIGTKTKSSPLRGIFTVFIQSSPPYCSIN